MIGIVGFACATGLGIAARDMYRHLGLDTWLVRPHPKYGFDVASINEGCVVWNYEDGAEIIEKWLSRIDTLFCIERPYIRNLWETAKSKDVRIVLMPNAEWLDLNSPTLGLIDTFIAPTRACAKILRDAGYAERTVYIPHAIDTERFAFRPRARAERFLHCRGWGGYAERKGTAIVLEAAKKCPEIRFGIHYQQGIESGWPANVDALGSTALPEDQYASGDVCIQPSRWEGVGLQILEAMSCGLPTLVTDAAPMNEYPANRDLCIRAEPSPVDLEGRMWTAWEADVDSLVSIIRQLHGRDISDLSRQARARMERRSWSRLAPAYLKVLGAIKTAEARTEEFEIIPS